MSRDAVPAEKAISEVGRYGGIGQGMRAEGDRGGEKCRKRGIY